jgi:hypothetical protein
MAICSKAFPSLVIHHNLQRTGVITQKDDRAILLSRLSRLPLIVSIPYMQRLFSMFPSGIAGAGLLILRVCAAAVLFVDGAAHPSEGKSIWLLLLFAIMSGTLGIGLLTPYAAAIGCLIELTVVWEADAQAAFHFIVAALNFAAIAMLGPGAYSLDARRFGRKLISPSAARKPADRE